MDNYLKDFNNGKTNVESCVFWEEVVTLTHTLALLFSGKIHMNMCLLFVNRILLSYY